MLHQKNPRVAERGRLLAISRSFEFPFCFSEHDIPVFFLYGCDRNELEKHSLK